MRPNATVPIVLAILVVILPGCAEVAPAPLSPEKSAADLETRSLDDPRLRDFIRASLAGEAAPDRAGSWDLAALTLAAVYFHPELDVARARLARARAAVVTAGQRPNPVLNLTAEVDRAAVAGAIPAGALPLTIGPVINLIVESFGKREARIGQAEQLGAAARWELQTASWQVRGRVRDALLDLWAARQRLELSRRRLALHDELVQLLERRLAVGEASASDASRERLARAQIAVDRGAFERAAGEAEARLAAAIAVPLKTLAGARLSFSAFDKAPAPPDAAGELRRRSLTGRSDVQAALAQYEAAQAALQLAVANQYPNLALGPGYVYDAGIEKFSLSPGVELPLFHQNQGQIAEAAAKRQEAAAEFTQLQARIIAAIDAALADVSAASRALATSDALLAGARRREAQLAASFNAGQADRPSLVAAQIEAAAVALQHFDARLSRLKALGALEDALQYPLFAPAAPFAAPETAA